MSDDAGLDSLLDEQRRMRAGVEPMLRATVSDAATVAPDAYAAQRRTAGYLGYPVDSIAADPKSAEQLASIDKVAADTAPHPPLQRRYTDRDFARLAHDDSGPLSAVAEAARYLVSAPGGRTLAGDISGYAGAFMPGWRTADLQASLTDLSMARLEGKTLTPEQEAQRQDLKRQLSEIAAQRPDGESPLEFAARTQGYSARQGASTLLSAAKGAGYGGVAGAALGAVAGGVGAAPGAAVGMTVGGALAAGMYAYRMEAASTYEELADSRDLNGRPLPDDIARSAAQVVGVVNAAIEVGSDALALKLLPGAEKFLATMAGKAQLVQAVKTAALDPAKHTALRAGLKALASTSFIEGAEEFFQQFVQAGGREAARAASGQEFKPVPFSQDLQEALGAQLEATVGTALTFGAFSGAANYVSVKRAQAQAQTAAAEQGAQHLGKLLEVSKNAKLLDRSPEVFRDTLNDLATQPDGAPQVVRFDAEALAGALAQSGMDRTEFDAKFPEVAKQLPEALAMGGEVSIPVGDYVTGVIGTPLEQALQEHARVGDNEFSQAEAADIVKEAEKALAQDSERVLAQAENADELRASGERVRQQVLERLTAAGRNTADVNEAYATLWQHFFTALAPRAGTTPEELFNRYNPRIQAVGPEGEALSQRGTEQVGGYSVRTEVDGGITVSGDQAEIRSLLPKEVKGRLVEGGVYFTPTYAPRVTAALSGEEVVHGRAGEVTDNPRYAGGARAGQYIGAPPAYSTPAKLPKLRRLLKHLAREGEAGRFWYERSGEAILQMVGHDREEARKFISLLAIYSPQAKVDANSTFALRAWAQYKAGMPISVKTADLDGKATRVLYQGEQWGGEKTNNFYRNLMRQVDAEIGKASSQGVTVDMWMMRAAGYDTDSPTQAAYRFVENETNRLAKGLGWEPQQVQAAIWVAMKARTENAGVKKATVAESIKKGFSHHEASAKGAKVLKVTNETEHRKIWLKHAMALQVSEQDTNGAKFDFSDGVRRHLGQVSWEARPGRTTGVLPGVNDAPYHLQAEFQQAIADIFTGPNGEDLLAQKLGLLVDGKALAPGVWQSEIAAGMQSFIAMAPAAGKEGTLHVDPAQAKTLGAYADIMGLLLRQEGVGWHRPFYSSNKADQNGVELRIGRGLTPVETGAVWAAVDREMRAAGAENWEQAAGLISSGEGIRVVNFGAIADNKQFRALVVKAAESIKGFDFEHGDFASDGDLRTNDWGSNPDGQEYRTRVAAAGRSDVLGWAESVLAPRIQGVFEDFSERYDWGDPGQAPGTQPATAEQAATQRAFAESLAQSAQRQTDAPEFKAWFGGSKVVDAQGRPLVVYHGTNEDFSKFDIAGANEVGSWFTAPSKSSAQALDRARSAADNFAYTQADLYGGNETVYPVHLAISNPKAFKGYSAFEKWSKQSANGAALRARLQAEGYDGLVIRNSRTDSGELRDDWVAFKPEQVKSAIGNRGAFDPNNPSILAQSDDNRAAYSPAERMISLLQNADLTSFLHESGHFFLDVLSDLASMPNAPAGIVDDFNAVLKWAGVTAQEWAADTAEYQATGKIPDRLRKVHENWAEGFEQYLFEGKAPSVELRGVFHRFKAWLTSVYGSLKKFMQSRSAVGGGPVLAQVSREQALDTNVKTEMPSHELFTEAVANTPGARVDDEGLHLNLVRFQKVEQEGERAVRTGVFYLPVGYGGAERMQGETLLRRPLFVKGATGGKAPEAAFDAIRGKGAMKALDKAVMDVVTSLGWMNRMDDTLFGERVKQFLSDNGGDPGLAWDIVHNSKEGNQLRYALQEHVIAHAVRAAGYDSVVGYSKGKAGAGISEVFDVREQTYPSRVLNAEIHQDFLAQSGVDQTDTPAFRAWFGDSKVVDAQGKPLAVYHGTASDVREFDPEQSGRNYRFSGGDKGFFFTSLSGTAEVYAEQAAEPFRKPDSGANIMPVYLSLQKPYVRQAQGSPDKWFDYNRTKVYEMALAKGADGIIVKGGAGVFEKRVVYVAFRPEQIKSAIGNSGTFDPSNPSILAQSDASQGRLRISPEIRGVMDRLLATEEQITEAEHIAGFEAIYRSADEAGMTPEEWDAYQAKNAEAHSAAVDSMQSRSLADLKWATKAYSRALKRMQAGAEDIRKTVAAEVSAEVADMPVERARAMIRELRVTSPEFKDALKDWKDRREAALERASAEVKAEYLSAPEAQGLKGLELAQYQARNAKLIANEAERRALLWERDNRRPTPDLPPLEMDMIAGATGFASGDELRTALLESPDARDLVEGMTEQRLLERYGDLVTPAGIAEAAAEAVHNEARARFVATELATAEKALAVTTDTGKTAKGGRRLTVNAAVQAAKNFAEELIGRRQIIEIKPAGHRQAETRAAREARRSMMKGDQAGVVAAKRDQLLQHYAAMFSSQALAEVDKGVAYLKKFDNEGTRKNLAGDYIDQIDKILERMDLRKATTAKAISERIALAKFIASQEEVGLETDIPEDLLEGSQARSYKEMTLEEFRGMVDAVRQIERLGRLKQRLLTARDKREFREHADDFAEGIAANAKKDQQDTRTPNTISGKALIAVKEFRANHILAAGWARTADGGKDNGVVWNTLIRPANASGDFEVSMRGEHARKAADNLDPVIKRGGMQGPGQMFKHVGRRFNREAILAMAVNTGNDSNLRRLLDGEGWTIDKLHPMLDTLTADDWRSVQAIWDHFESLRPQVAAMYERMGMKQPEWLAPAPRTVQTADGQTVELRGGYYPVKFDPRASVRAGQHVAAEEGKMLTRAAYTASTTRNSYTKSRVKQVTGRPLLYSLDGYYNGLNEVIHDLAWHEWVIDASRLLRDTKAADAIRVHYGPEQLKSLTDWVADIATDGYRMNTRSEAIWGFVRRNASFAGLAFNVLVAAIQPLGFAQTIPRIGVKWATRGVAAVVADPIAAHKHAVENSTMMAHRSETRLRELDEVKNRVKGRSALAEGWYDAGYTLTSWAQHLVDVPTWRGAYEKAISEGNGKDTAIALADQAVIDSQGGGSIKDLTAIERGGPAAKLFTVFMHFPLTVLNLLSTQTATRDSKAALAMDYVLLGLLPAVLVSQLRDALTPGDNDDEKGIIRRMLGELLGYFTGMIYGVRDVGGVIANQVQGNPYGTDYTGPVGTRLLSDTAKLTQQVGQWEWDDAMRKAIVNFAGTAFRLPSAQINRSWTGLKAFARGETENPAAIITGYQQR